jgi:hypothetical protein
VSSSPTSGPPTRLAIWGAALFWTFALGLAVKLWRAAEEGIVSVYFKGSGSRLVSRMATPEDFEFEFNFTLVGLGIVVFLAVFATWCAVRFHRASGGNSRRLSKDAL